MGLKYKAARRAVWFINGVVDTAVLIIILLFVVVGCFAIWDSKQIYQAADAKHYEVYKPTDEKGELSFKELQAINPDVFSWLTVYGTHIDYPVVQGEDNMKYINTNAEGRYSLSGAIFMDFHCSKDFSDFSSILYGHHMDKDTMFGEIGDFSDISYFSARKYGSLYYGGREHGLEFFAFLHADAYDDTIYRTNIIGKEARTAYLSALLSKSMHTRDIKVTADDRIILLSTCSASSTNGRDILVGRITDKVFDDHFKTGIADGGAPAAIGLKSLLSRLPVWVWMVIITLLLALPIWLLAMLLNDRKRYHNRRGDETPFQRR